MEFSRRKEKEKRRGGVFGYSAIDYFHARRNTSRGGGISLFGSSYPNASGSLASTKTSRFPPREVQEEKGGERLRREGVLSE